MRLVDRVCYVMTKLPGMRSLWTRFPFGDVATRVTFGVWRRPHYAYGVYHAALQSRALSLPGVTVIELGVAGGTGLLNLEEHAAAISEFLQYPIDVIGFDTGRGMPRPKDYRDLPHVWGGGYYEMDQTALRSRLTNARLVLGDVGETLLAEATGIRYPIGFMAFDLDYYSSTQCAMRVFDAPCQTRLPRVYCYFDDIIWPEHALHCEYIGELAAIADFNQTHTAKKIAKIAHLGWTRYHQSAWCEQFYAMHDFTHPLYPKNITPIADAYRQHRLNPKI